METQDTGAVAVAEPPARQLPWAGITTGAAKDGELLTSEQMLDRAGLNWDVEIRPYQRRLRDGSYVPSTRMFETFRIGDDGEELELGAVKKRYQVLPNREAFNFGDSIVEAGAAHWAEAGMQGNGYRVFMTMVLEEEFKVLGNDPFRMYMFFSTSHDGGRSLMAAMTPIRARCTNQTAIIAADNYGRYSISHTGDISAKIATAVESVRNAGKQSKLLKTEAEKLAKVKVTDDKARYLLTSIIPQRRAKRDELIDAIMIRHSMSPSVAGYEGTGWSLLNAATEHMDHGMNRRSGNAQYESVTFGEGAKLRQRLASALAELS